MCDLTLVRSENVSLFEDELEWCLSDVGASRSKEVGKMLLKGCVLPAKSEG